MSATDLQVQSKYVVDRPVGQGTFGTVTLAKSNTGVTVAIKKVMQDPRFKNRELQIMQMLNHPNVISLVDHFYTRTDTRPEEIYLNLVMDFVPDTLHRCCRNYLRSRHHVPMILVKLFMYQLIRSIGYLHLPRINICHRDIKPHNVLVNVETGLLKLCDFGSAKQLTNEPNVAYICSRYYRAPELIFGNLYYTVAVDVWSVGCIMGEMLLGDPLFRGENSMGQLVEIVKILGTPTKEQLEKLNSRADGNSGSSSSSRLADIKPRPWSTVFSEHVPPEAHDLISKLLAYVPSERIKPFEALMHPFFNDLHNPETRLPNGNRLPPLFHFSSEEKANMTPEQISKLVRG